MAVIIKLATININGITNHTRMGMLTDYIRQHGLDIVLLQEVIDPGIFHLPGYEVYYNIGSNTRGTAIVARSHIMLTNINKIPSGRAIAAEYNGWHIINIYAPSGTAKRAEREQFYNVDVPQLIQTGRGDLLIGGDFNCLLNPADTSGSFQNSRALTEMIRGLHLEGTVQQVRNKPVFTHYFSTGASRLDRIYVARDLTSTITGVDILPAAFTDHNAVILRLMLGDRRVRRCKMRWKMDPTSLCDADLLTNLRQLWSRWTSTKLWFANVNIWWDRFVKPRLQRHMRIWSAERRRDFKNMENHLYTCIYNIKQSNMSPDQKLAALNRYKTKLVRLQARKTEPLQLDVNERDRMEGEEPSLYHLIKASKRREARTIRRIQDQGGRTTDDPQEIERIFLTHLKEKYSPYT